MLDQGTRSFRRFALRGDADGELICEFDSIAGLFVGAWTSGDEFDHEESDELEPVTFELTDLARIAPVLTDSIDRASGPPVLGNLSVRILDARGRDIGEYHLLDAELLPESRVGGSDQRIVLRGWMSVLPHRAAGQVWEQWRHGLPAVAGGWTSIDPGDRAGWLEVAMRYVFPRYAAPERGSVVLDDKSVGGLAGFFCALGEAVNGPGGYFGANFMALFECARGGFGARPGFTLQWHNSAANLAELSTVVETARGPMTYFDIIVSTLTEAGANVALL